MDAATQVQDPVGHQVLDPVGALLARQGGLARRRELIRAGLTRRGLERRVRDGSLRALTPHLFTDVDRPRPDEQLRRDAIGLDAVVSHTSAALLWGLELVETPTERCPCRGVVPESRPGECGCTVETCPRPVSSCATGCA